MYHILLLCSAYCGFLAVASASWDMISYGSSQDDCNFDDKCGAVELQCWKSPDISPLINISLAETERLNAPLLYAGIYFLQRLTNYSPRLNYFSRWLTCSMEVRAGLRVFRNNIIKMLIISGSLSFSLKFEVN